MPIENERKFVLDDDGKLAMTVRVDPTQAGKVRAKFPTLSHH